MKKALSVLMILVLVGILVLGASAVYAADDNGIDHSKACDHVPETSPALNNANLESVLSDCPGFLPG